MHRARIGSRSGPTNIRFSIIIPAHDAEAHLDACLGSALSIDYPRDAYEVLVVDDGSTDGTAGIARSAAARHTRVLCAANRTRGGPGLARNAGLDRARGEYVLFLDSDDRLLPDSLSRLEKMFTPDTDVLAFDWRRPLASAHAGGRTDRDAFAADREHLLKRYLALQMDGSVIFTAVRRELLGAHGLRFSAGYHEDVDFLFRCYFHARAVSLLDTPLYEKSDRPGSIVNSISPAHLTGFARAWSAIGEFLATLPAEERDRRLAQHRTGWIAVIATRVREIVRWAGEPSRAAALFDALFLLVPAAVRNDPPRNPRTKYERIAARFLETMRDDQCPSTARATSLGDFVRELAPLSWSCVDLHHSAFLAPGEIRTCCKRFFVDGRMRGDVKLLDAAAGAVPNAAAILREKRNLHIALNRGDVTPCDGCPFLEFKDWGPLDRLKIRYLSLEYHSVCNLTCTYCSEAYYGGAKAGYDPAGLVEDLHRARAIDLRAHVVWGGGEPSVDPLFPALVEDLVARIPDGTHRVLTNAVKHSPAIERLLARGAISVTISVDAGNAETFARVRGRRALEPVVANLKRYAEADARRVTIKYIFTEGNRSLDEARAYAALVASAGLSSCNFQISSDFTEERITRADTLAMIAMYGWLLERGCRVVFFDDLLRQRLGELQSPSDSTLRDELACAGVVDVLADPERIPRLAIWGAGWLAKYMLENAAYCKRADVAFFVDSTPSKIGTTYLGRPVLSPEALLRHDIPVAIAACQGYPIIYERYLELGLSPARLVTKLIL